MNEEHVQVRYKFIGEKNFTSINVTIYQYKNLLEIPVVDECEIIGMSGKPIWLSKKKRNLMEELEYPPCCVIPSKISSGNHSKIMSYNPV